MALDLTALGLGALLMSALLLNVTICITGRKR
jgi:hypothetical protein